MTLQIPPTKLWPGISGFIAARSRQSWQSPPLVLPLDIEAFQPEYAQAWPPGDSPLLMMERRDADGDTPIPRCDQGVGDGRRVETAILAVEKAKAGVRRLRNPVVPPYRAHASILHGLGIIGRVADPGIQIAFVDAAPFPDDHGDSVLHELGVDAVELLVHFAFVGGRTPLRRRGGRGVHGEVVGVIGMLRDDDAGVVRGKHQVVLGIRKRGGGMGLDHDVPERVIPSGGAHGAHDGRIVFIQDAARLGRSARPFCRFTVKARFVERFENQMVAIVLEAVGDLRPDLGDLFLNLRLGAGFQGHPFIVMGVEDDITFVVDPVIHDLLHPVHPGLVDGVVGRSAEMIFPGDGHTERTETFGLQVVEHGLGGFGIAPTGFRGDAGHPIAFGIQGISQIPTHLHFLNDLHGGHIAHGAGCLGSGLQEGTGQGQQGEGRFEGILIMPQVHHNPLKNGFG